MGKTSQREVWCGLCLKIKNNIYNGTVPARTKHDRDSSKGKRHLETSMEQNILRKLLHSKNSPFLTEKEEDMLCNNKHAKQSTGKYSKDVNCNVVRDSKRLKATHFGINKAMIKLQYIDTGNLL